MKLLTYLFKRFKNKSKLSINKKMLDKCAILSFDAKVIHINGIAIEVNNSLCELSGYHKNELMGKNIVELFVPDRFHQLINEKQQFDVVRSYDIEIRKKNGDLLPVEVQAKKILYDNKEARIALIKDISDRKRIEKELFENEQKYFALFENANDTIFIMKNDKIIDCNARTTSFFACRKEDIINKTPYELSPEYQPDGQLSSKKVEQKIDEALNGKVGVFEWLHQRMDGSLFFAEINLNPVIFNGEKFVQAIVRDISFRKNAEFQLRITQYSIDKSSYGVYWFNSQGKLTYVNEMAGRLLGYNKQELLTMNVSDISSEIDNEKWPIYWDAIKRKGTSQKETYHRHKNGSLVPVQVTANYFEFEGQEYVFTVVLDITQRKETEDALKKSENQYRLLFNELNHGFTLNQMIYDDAGKPVDYVFLDVNPAFEKLTHLKRDTIIGKSVKEVISGIDDKWIHRFGEVVKTGVPKAIDQYSAEIDKHLNLIVYSPQKDQFAVIATDITAQKKAIAELAKSEERYKLMAENITNFLILFDGNFNKLYVSPSIEKYLGYSKEELMTLKLLELIHPDDLPIIKKRLALLNEVNHDSTAKLTYKIRKKTGEYIWIESITYWKYNDQGELIRILVNSRDITENKNFENSLKIKNQELLKANEELDNFVYRVSHDLRAPLTSSLGLAQLTQKEKDLETIWHYAKLQEESLVKLDDFILDILKYSRNSRMPVAAEIIHFEQVINEIYQQYKHNKAYQKIIFQCNISNTIEYRTDKQRLEFVLSNLISNAFKFHNPYIDDPNIKIDIKVNDQEAEIIIADNGIGIGKEHLDKIFSMFYRATDRNQGSGLGLYIVKDCINKINGSIRVESEPGNGARFILHIPNVKEQVKI